MQLEEMARLSQIIEELLFLSRAEARDIEAQSGAARPQSTACKVRVRTRECSRSIAGCTLRRRHEGSGKAVLVEPRWLRRVLLNLLGNALNASPPGGTVTLNSDGGCRVWRVSLEDKGPGVAAELRERISSVFFVCSAAPAEEKAAAWGLPFAAASLVARRDAMGGSLRAMRQACAWYSRSPASRRRMARPRRSMPRLMAYCIAAKQSRTLEPRALRLSAVRAAPRITLWCRRSSRCVRDLCRCAQRRWRRPWRAAAAPDDPRSWPPVPFARWSRSLPSRQLPRHSMPCRLQQEPAQRFSDRRSPAWGMAALAPGLIAQELAEPAIPPELLQWTWRFLTYLVDWEVRATPVIRYRQGVR